jgi:hypothetical protein
MSEERLTRREVLKKAAYVTPVILTLKANFSFASAGSGDYPDETNTTIEYLGRGDEKDKKEKKHEKKSTDNSDKKNWTNHSRP